MAVWSRRAFAAFVTCCLLVICLSLTGCSGQAASTGANNPPSTGSPPGSQNPPTAANNPPSAGSPPGSQNPPGGNPGGSAPLAEHVVIVVLENHSYETVIGSSAMPYFNSLASRYALATAFYANTHPSIGNYFMLTTGQIITNDDNYTGTVSADNVVLQLAKAGKSWKAYAEDLPQTGYTGGNTGLYVKRHNPFVYLANVINDPQQTKNIVPFSQFGNDLAAGTLPNYSFVIPNQAHNAHDCPSSPCQDSDKLQAADNWLRSNLEPLLSNPAFVQSGVLVVTWDEGDASDPANGGGHIAVIVAGPKVKTQYQSTMMYQHQSVLRLTLSALGVPSFPGAASNAPPMDEFFP